MGLVIQESIQGKPEPEQSVENVTYRIEIADNPIESIMTEIYLRELAFQRAFRFLQKCSGKCEIRTFLNSERMFRDEYYSWNYEPNRNQNKHNFLISLSKKCSGMERR